MNENVAEQLEAAVEEVFKGLVLADDHTAVHAAGALVEMMRSINAVGVYEYLVPMIPDVRTYPDYPAYVDDIRAWTNEATLVMAAHLTNHGLEYLRIRVLHECTGEYRRWTLRVTGTTASGSVDWDLTTEGPA